MRDLIKKATYQTAAIIIGLFLVACAEEPPTEESTDPAIETSTSGSNGTGSTFTLLESLSYGSCSTMDTELDKVALDASGLTVNIEVDASTSTTTLSAGSIVEVFEGSDDISTTLSNSDFSGICINMTDADGRSDSECDSEGFVVPTANTLGDTAESDVEIVLTGNDGGTAHAYLAQSFKKTGSSAITGIYMHDFFAGGDTVVSIYSDNGGEPGSLLYTLNNEDGNIYANSGCESGSNHTFENEPTMTAGTTYWIVRYSSDIDGTDYSEYIANGYQYDYGTALRSTDGSTWESACRDTSDNADDCSVGFGVY